MRLLAGLALGGYLLGNTVGGTVGGLGLLLALVCGSALLLWLAAVEYGSRMRRRAAVDDLLVSAQLARRPWSTGWELCKATGLRSGPVSVALDRLMARGEIVDRWVQPDGAPANARRRQYALTDQAAPL